MSKVILELTREQAKVILQAFSMCENEYGALKPGVDDLTIETLALVEAAIEKGRREDSIPAPHNPALPICPWEATIATTTCPKHGDKLEECPIQRFFQS